MIPSNPRRSGGPRTEAGKQASAQNAVKKGAYAKEVVLPGEDGAQFQTLVERLYEEYEPVGVMESSMVRDLASCVWRKLRYDRLEMAHFLETYFYRKASYFDPDDQQLESEFAPARTVRDARRGVFEQRLYKYLLAHNTQRPTEDLNRVMYKTLTELRKLQDWRFEREAREEALALEGGSEPSSPGPEDAQVA